MRRITGLPDDVVAEYELRIELLIRTQLQMVMDRIADQISSIQTASGYRITLPSNPIILVAADPPDDGLPPGQPYVSPDDLAQIPPAWRVVVDQVLLEVAAEVFLQAAGTVYAQMVDATGVSFPRVGSLAAEQYMSQMRNSFDDIGNELWETARSELLNGFERGESIPQLADRLRASAGMTAKSAVLMGRTKVIEASNAGSLATARAVGIEGMLKEWISTPDVRTRPTHMAADGQRVPLSEKFVVGGYPADFPADPDLPPAESHNCRCAVGYVMSESDVDEAQVQADEAAQVLPGQSVRALPKLPSRPEGADEFGNLLEDGRWFDDDGGYLTNKYVDQFGLPRAQISFGQDSRGSYSVVHSTRGDFHITRQRDGGPSDALYTRDAADVSVSGLDAAGIRSFADDLDRALVRRELDVDVEEVALPGPIVNRATGLTLAPSRNGVNVTGLGKGDVFLEFGDAGSLSTTVREYLDGTIPRAALPRPSMRIAPSLVPEAARVEGFVSAVTTIRAPLRAAKTERDLQRAWRAEFERVAQRDILIQIPPGASLQTMRQYAEGTLQALERFPDAKIGEIGWWNDVGGAYAQVVPGGRYGATLQFNSYWASQANRAKLLRAQRSDIAGWDKGRNGWSPRNSGMPQATAYHEFAHVLDLENLGDIGPKALALVRQRAIRDGVDEDALVSRDISIYAGSDQSEMIAEAFADVMTNGPDASLISKEIYALIETEYRRGGFAIRMASVDELAEEVRAFARAPSPVSRLSSMTVPQLRALAKERGVAVPSGTRKAELVRLLEGEPALPRAVLGRELGVAFDARLRAARKGNAATAQTEYRFTGNAQQNADLFPDRAERVAVMDAFAGYRGVGSARINRRLRSGEPITDTRVVEMDKAFARSPLVNDVVVYRGGRGVEFGSPEAWGDNLEGREWVERAYTSTSVDLAVARPFASDGVMFRILAPRGTPAVGIRPAARIEAREREILLGRDQRFRVVRDHGASPPSDLVAAMEDLGGRARVRRFLDVEVVPAAPSVIAPVTPPVSVTSKLTVAQLRALARERGIDVPAGTRKAELARLLDSTPEVSPAQAKRVAARVRNAQIESGRGTANLLAEVDQLLANKAAASVIRERLSEALIEPEQLFAGADRTVLIALREALATGDMAKVRSAVTRLSTKAKIKAVGGKAGAKAKYDADTMESLGGVDIPAGAQVMVVKRGSTLTLPDGEVVQLERALVTPAVKLVKAAPVKAGKPTALAPRSTRKAGVDITEDVRPTVKRWLEPAKVRAFSEGMGDSVTTHLVEQQKGWATKGRVVASEKIDDAVAGGWIEMWRGVTSGGSSISNPMSAAEIAEATRTGSWRMGFGQYGNGIYTSVRRTTAEMYRGGAFRKPAGFLLDDPKLWGAAPNYEFQRGFDVAEQGGLMRMALDPKAKIVDHWDLKREHLDYLRQSGYSGGVPTDWQDLLMDQNAYAIMRGYDGVRVRQRLDDDPTTAVNDGSRYPPGVANRDEPNQYIIFNRSVLIFEEASDRYDT